MTNEEWNIDCIEFEEIVLDIQAVSTHELLQLPSERMALTSSFDQAGIFKSFISHLAVQKSLLEMGLATKTLIEQDLSITKVDLHGWIPSFFELNSRDVDDSDFTSVCEGMGSGECPNDRIFVY